MGMSEILKIYGGLSHTFFDLKSLERLKLGIDFLIISLGSLNNLVSMRCRPIKYHWL